MSFALRFLSDSHRVEPGSTVAVTFEVHNRMDTAQTLEVIVEGLDPEWIALPVPSFRVDPDERVTHSIFIKPPRETQSLAGDYPFAIKIRSLDSGDSRALQGMMEVQSYFHMSVDLQPKKGVVSPFKKQADFQLTAVNMGNNEVRSLVAGTDQDESCAFDFEETSVTLAPGQQKDIGLKVRATKSALLANNRLHSFNVTVRNADRPALGVHTQGHLEQRALLSPGLFLVFSALILLVVGWFVFYPKAPETPTINVLPIEGAMVGEPVLIQWNAPGADEIRLRINEEQRTLAARPSEFEFVPEEAGRIDIEIIAFRRNLPSERARAEISVRARELAPAPEITRFEAPAEVNFGENFIIRYAFNEAVVSARLQPVERELDPAANSIAVTAEVEGTISYTIVARNADGQVVTRERSVRVVRPSQAVISSFRAVPRELDPFDLNVTLEWQVAGATNVRIEYVTRPLDAEGEVRDTISVDPGPGRYSMFVRGPTQFRLIATDAQGLSVEQNIEVTVASQPTPIPEDATN